MGDGQNLSDSNHLVTRVKDEAQVSELNIRYRYSSYLPYCASMKRSKLFRWGSKSNSLILPYRVPTILYLNEPSIANYL